MKPNKFDRQLRTFSKKCQDWCLFDIADTSRVRSKKEVVERVELHIEWFRDHADESLYAMEKMLEDYRYGKAVTP